MLPTDLKLWKLVTNNDTRIRAVLHYHSKANGSFLFYKTLSPLPYTSFTLLLMHIHFVFHMSPVSFLQDISMNQVHFSDGPDAFAWGERCLPTMGHSGL